MKLSAKKLLTGIAGVAFAISLSAVAQSTTTGEPGNTGAMNSMDHKFLRDAAQGGLAEVELGKLATEKASSEDVKKFGQRMVDDHSKANDELKQLAASENVQLPASLAPRDKALKDRLSELSGRQFDAAYMKVMVSDHQKDVAEFQGEASKGQDPKLKDFASRTQPTLQEHLHMAQQIEPQPAFSAAAAPPPQQPGK